MNETLVPGIEYIHKFRVTEAKTIQALYPESEEFLAMPEVFATGFMIGFLEWRYQVESLEPTASEESIQDRLGRLTPMVEQILKTASTLSVGTIDIQDFAMMNQNLVDIRQLSRDLKQYFFDF